MNRNAKYIAVLFLLILSNNESKGQVNSVVKDTCFKSTGNPIITHKYTADAAALVYKDKVHQAIINFKGRDYFIYHNGALVPDGGSFHRSVCIDYLYYNKDGTMKRVVMTSEGVSAIKN